MGNNADSGNPVWQQTVSQAADYISHNLREAVINNGYGYGGESALWVGQKYDAAMKMMEFSVPSQSGATVYNFSTNCAFKTPAQRAWGETAHAVGCNTMLVSQEAADINMVEFEDTASTAYHYINDHVPEVNPNLPWVARHYDNGVLNFTAVSRDGVTQYSFVTTCTPSQKAPHGFACHTKRTTQKSGASLKVTP